MDGPLETQFGWGRVVCALAAVTLGSDYVVLVSTGVAAILYTGVSLVF